MLILNSGGQQVVIMQPPGKACSCAHLVDSYVWQCLAADTQNMFELHLMECSSCLHSVELERLLRRAIRETKTGCGIPCATRVRRIR